MGLANDTMDFLQSSNSILSVGVSGRRRWKAQSSRTDLDSIPVVATTRIRGQMQNLPSFPLPPEAVPRAIRNFTIKPFKHTC